MKKTITLLAAVFAFCVMAEPLNLQVPFKKGRKTPIAWWNGKATLVEVDGVNAAAIEKRNALPANEKSAMKAKLEKEGLPTAYKNVTDVEVLKKVLKAFD